jgi:hypothetical protein
MQVRTQKWIVWFWALSLLVSTTGISLHQIYCFCVGERSVSIFTQPQDACLASNTCVAGESLATTYNCCKKKAQSAQSCCKADKSSDHDGSCAHKTTQFFKLKSELQSQQLEQFDLAKASFSIEASGICSSFDLVFPFAARQLPLFSADLPPPISGRHLCLLYCIFRC